MKLPVIPDDNELMKTNCRAVINILNVKAIRGRYKADRNNRISLELIIR